jgi:two-component system, NtrC family, response regulator AtoC
MKQELSDAPALAAIVGNSPAIAALREQIRHLAAFDTVGNPHVPTTLVMGETGTGKGLVARAIHECGPRARGPFIDVNCAAIPENLLEAELFGFDAGAFTDAKRAKPGLFEAASKGTLFLDEIDALPLPLQAKFLKAVEDKRVRRLGAVTDRGVDVKIIAATQIDLSASVKEGRFRLDLYHRLASVILAIPPLRERGSDILVIAEYYLTHYATVHGIGAIALTESARAGLMRYPWPGNVRELSHLLERLALSPQDRPVDGALLEELCVPAARPALTPPPPAAETGDTDEAVRIRHTLTSTGGNVLRAARILGLSRNALRYRMRRYGIDRPLLGGEAPPQESAAARMAREDGDHLPTAATITVSSAPQTTGADPQSQIIGRKKELERLREALDSVAAGNARAVIAMGEAGIGKTRLLRELRATSEENGFLWLEGYYDRTGNHPYQAWVQILRQSLDRREAAWLVQTLRPRFRDLAKLVPQFGENGEPAPPPGGDPETERLRLFESLTEFFLQLSRKSPLVLFLDDLQWAPTLDFIHYLLRNITGERILLLATCRSDELKRYNELWRTLMSVQREPICQTLPLNPFDQTSVEQLINARIGGAVTPSLTGAIAAKTSGNPFFIEEIVKSLQEQGALLPTDSGWELTASHRLGLPDSVKMIVSQRIERLGKPTVDLLALAAVIGRQFTQSLLRSLADAEEETIADALDRCEDAGIVLAAPELANDGYKFAHDLMQESLYESIGPAQRRRHHLQIGHALESALGRDGDDDSETLVYHFAAGNDLAKALTYSLKAGENAERSFSWARAAAHFETALALLERQFGDAAAQARLHEKLADLASLLGHANLAHSHRALEIFTALNDWPRVCRLQRLIGVAWTSGTAGKVDLEKALDHFEKATEIIATQPDSTEKALAHGYLAFGLLRAKLDLPRAASEADKALVIANELNDADVKARVYTELGVIHAFTGDLTVAEENAEQSWRISQRAKDPWMSARAALYPITFWPWRNDRLWLERWVRRCFEQRQSFRVTRYDLATYSLQALYQALTGQPEQARQALNRAARALAERDYFTPYWLHFPAAVYGILGENDNAAELFREARRASQAGNLISNLAEVVLYVRFLMARGNLADAKEILEVGHSLAQERESIVQQLNLAPLLVEVYSQFGELQRAGDLLAQVQSLQNRLSAWSGLAAPVLTARGVLAAARMDWDQAEKSFTSALDLERQHGFLYTEASILLKWADLCHRRRGANDEAKANDLRNQALSIFERCGAAADAEGTRRSLSSQL